MAIRANKKYTGTVTGGAFFESSMNLTPGYQVFLECEDGDTDYVIWLTEKNRKKVARDFKVLGADMSRMKEPQYLQYELSGVITGKNVTFEARDEEWRGEVKTKVAWIGRVSAASEEEIIGSVSAFFAQQQTLGTVRDPVDNGPAIDDEDIPF
jgi:hypothetical protein